MRRSWNSEEFVGSRKTCWLSGPYTPLRWSVEVFPPDGGVGVLLEFIRRVTPMKTTMRGRSRLDLDLNRILAAVRRHRQVLAAARELSCSDAYIHVRFKQEGLTLGQVLEASDLATLSHTKVP